MTPRLEGLSLIPDQQSGPNCGVTSIAILTGQSFSKVWHIMEMNKSANWKGRTDNDDRDRALRILGFKLVTTSYYQSRRPSLRYFAHHVARRGQPYLVLTSGHAQVVLNQMVQDQGGICHVNHHWGRNKYVYRYSIVVPDDSSTPSVLDSFIGDLS